LVLLLVSGSAFLAYLAFQMVDESGDHQVSGEHHDEDGRQVLVQVYKAQDDILYNVSCNILLFAHYRQLTK
jgi:hypothetical protein